MKHNPAEIIANKNKEIYLQILEKRANQKLIKRYSKHHSFYNIKMINNILNNERTHYVEMFKEYLLYEDYNEFLRQYYGKSLLKTKLQKILNFYEKYSKIFPNYTALRESKYLYKNIKRKQKVINQINENKRNENLDEESYSSYNKTIFNSKVINSIYTGHNTITINKNNDNNTLLTNDNSVCNFIEQISILEKETKKIKEQKNKIKEDKNTYKKNGQINFKKLSNLLVNSSNYNSNNFIKNRVKIDFKRNFIERHPNTSNKIKLNPYNYISKQKSYSNIIGSNKKISSTNKNDITNINNNSRRVINNNSIMAKTNGLKYYLDYEKYKKILLSTNSTNTPKIMPERMLSSPKRIKNIRFAKKRCISNSRVGSNYNNNCLKRNMNSTNALSKNSIFKNNRNNISNSNILKDEKKLLKCQINKQSKNKLLNNFHPESVNKYYSNNISHLNTKNKNTRKNNVYNNKNKIVNNYNIMNGIMNNSTQINIYTGNDLIKSLNLYWNSIINSTKSNSPFYDSNLSKKKLGIKSLSKKNKKIKNMKQIIEKHMKEKKLKEPNTERNSSNEKLLKLLDIYCKGVKKHRNTNMKKNNVIKNKLNKSHIYKTKSRTKYEERSIKDFIYKKSNNNFDIFKDKEKNISSNTSTNKKNLIKTNRIIK
jgi:hypothetical protein